VVPFDKVAGSNPSCEHIPSMVESGIKEPVTIVRNYLKIRIMCISFVVLMTKYSGLQSSVSTHQAAMPTRDSPFHGTRICTLKLRAIDRASPISTCVVVRSSSTAENFTYSSTVSTASQFHTTTKSRKVRRRLL
jgi:hypothetical protein